MANQYKPWKELGLTELGYFQQRFLEFSALSDTLAKQNEILKTVMLSVAKTLDEITSSDQFSTVYWARDQLQVTVEEIENLADANSVTPQPDNRDQVIEILKDKVIEHRKAYSIEIFPNSETIDDSSSRDSIAAAMGRHMCDCFLRYLADAEKVGVPGVPKLEVKENITSERCPSCGNQNFMVARNMLATRHCISCNHEWLPEKVGAK